MATINGTTNNSGWTYKLEVSESNVNINNNTSVVTVKAYIGRASSKSYLGGAWSGSITVNGSSQNMSGTITYPTYINGGAWLHLATKTYTVTHNNDGSKTVGVSSSFSSNDFTPSSASASGNVTLTTIPRSSTITATSVYIGETSQLTITRYSNSFTHTIYYSFGSLNGYILANGTTTSTATKISATSIGFPIPNTWFAQIPNAKQGTCTLTITTYNGNTQISSTKTTTFVARVDQATSSPIVTSVVEDTNATTLALTRNKNILVKGYSTAKTTWNTTAKNSSTISNVKINNTTVTTSPYSFTLNDSFINVVATDSRDFSTTISPTFTLKDYNSPLFTMTLKRVAPTSSFAYLSFNGSWFNDSFGGTTKFSVGEDLKYSNTEISIPNDLYNQLGTTDTLQTFLTTSSYKIVYEVVNNGTTRDYFVELQNLSEPLTTNLVIYYAQETINSSTYTIYKNINNLEVNENFGTIDYIDNENILYSYFDNTDNIGATINELTISWKYKKSTDSNWTNGGTFVENTDYKINGNSFYSGNLSSPTEIQIGGNLDYNYAWDIMIYVEDELSTFNIYQTMTQGIPVINWGSDYFNVNGVIKKNNVSIGLTKLWENSSPTSSFAPQTIYLDNDNYDYLVWIFKHARTVNRVKSTICLKGSAPIFDLAWDYGASNNWYFAEHYRALNYSNDTTYTVDNCCVRYNSWTNTITDNNYLIPIAVYGGKF